MMNLYSTARRIAANYLQPRLSQHAELIHRCQAIETELEFSNAECKRLAEHLSQLKGQLNQSLVQHRSFETIDAEAVTVSSPSTPTSIDLVQRIQRAYRQTHSDEVGPRDSQWLGPIAEQKQDFHDFMLRDSAEVIVDLLQRPLTTKLFHGFDSISALDTNLHDTGQLIWRARWTYDNLLRLAEATAAIRSENLEAPSTRFITPLEDIMVKLDQAFGFSVQFPNPFFDEPGLRTSRGVATFRAVQALYQAWRIYLLVGSGGKVAEIGAGTGRTAYYAKQFGIEDYTIFDLPLTNVAQAHFLGSALGNDAISLFGERSRGRQIKILPPSQFATDERFDLIVNVDSITEMSRDTALDYLMRARIKCPVFLSINHEANSFTARELGTAVGVLPASRESCWMRRGYVEEIFRFPPTRDISL